MKRRDFVKNISAAIGAPLLLGGNALRAMEPDPQLKALTKNADGRVLVLIRLNGGNDGLNTLIPIDQYTNLAKARPNILIPENKVLKLNDAVGLHPAMAGLQQMYNNEKVCFIQSVGYPNPNFSHFRSTDIMMSASDSDKYVSSGWIGRHFDIQHPAYPSGYPNESYPDPIAVTIGSSASSTCQGIVTNTSVAIKNAGSSYAFISESEDVLPGGSYGAQLDFVRQTMRQTQDYLSVMETAYQKGSSISGKFPEAGINPLADKLKLVARLITGGLHTSLYVVDLGGFDTHANQVDETEGVLVGRHSDLLTKLSTAVDAFQDELTLQKIEDRVLGMTFSEFGRRIKSNNSFGTDHGAAYPMMVFGSRVNPTILGQNPSIASEVSQKDNIPMQYDFRSVYASVLKDWMNVSEENIENILFGSFQYLPILKTLTAVEEFQAQDLMDVQLYPNPASEIIQLKWKNLMGVSSITVFNAMGQQIKVLDQQKLEGGEQETHYSIADLPNGHYYLRIQCGSFQQTEQLIIKR